MIYLIHLNINNHQLKLSFFNMIKEDLYVIHIENEKNEHRKNNIIEEFSETFNINFVDGVINNNGTKGCF